MLINKIKSFFFLLKNIIKGRKEYFHSFKKQFGKFGKYSCIEYPSNITYKNNIFIGENTIILKYSRINIYNYLTNLNSTLNIGDNVYIGAYCTILVGENITIDNNVLIASNVIISSENHGMDPESEIPYMNQPLICKKIHIGAGCWIGEKVCILPGVSLGSKCIVGAGSVVTKSFPDYCMIAGNPAKIIKQYDFSLHKWVKI